MSTKSKITRISPTDLDPDGVRIVVDWGKFKPGASVFIPCLNTREAVNQVRKHLGLNAKETRARVGIEDGYYGVRVWRVGSEQ